MFDPAAIKDQLDAAVEAFADACASQSADDPGSPQLAAKFADHVATARDAVDALDHKLNVLGTEV
jgi:ubiquinone biosynthesis protein UbiJ